MKSTGVVRKVDELGRVVIPIELRRVLGIAEKKDALEIFVDEDKIILQKYAPPAEKIDVLKNLEVLARNATGEEKETLERAMKLIR